jgi:Bacterial SH3 domain
MVGGVMIKLLAVLLLGLYVTLQLAGVDRGQLRPGLAIAVTKEAEPVEIVPVVETQSLAATTTTSTRDAAVGQPKPIAITQAEPAPELVEVAFTPAAEPPIAPPRQADKVFTLSALPGQENAPPSETIATSAAVQSPSAEVWYVTGRSVNVREGPSTDAPIVGKLVRGDSALMLADNGAGWAQVTVEGDGVTGYVSMDFISPEAP